MLYLRDKNKNILEDLKKSNIVKTTYDSILKNVNSGTLYQGRFYEISDFQTVHLIPNTTVRNIDSKLINEEPIIVYATSKSTLAPEAHSKRYPNDILYYNIDNERWGILKATGSKGMITRRVDTDKRIDMPQDFRACVFRRWNADLSAATLNSHASIDCLWDTAVSTGCVGAPSTYIWSNRHNLTAIDVDIYTDYFMFNDYANSFNVYVERAEGGVIANTIFKGNVTDTFIKVLGNNTFGLVERLESHWVDRNISVPLSYQSIDTIVEVKSFGGNFMDYSVNLTVGHIWFENAKGRFTNNTFTFIGTGKNQLVFNIVEDVDGVAMTINSTGVTENQVKMDLRSTRYLTVWNLDGDKEAWDSRDYNTIVGGGADEFWLPYQTVLDFTSATNTVQYNIDQKLSNVATTKAASTAMTLVLHTPDIMAGILNLTGTGTIAIGTLEFASVKKAQTIKVVPAAGLIIDIPKNDVEHGFINQTIISADGTLGEYLFLERMPNKQWRAYN